MKKTEASLFFQNSLSPDSTEFFYGFQNNSINYCVIGTGSFCYLSFASLFWLFHAHLLLSSYLIVTIV